MNRESILLRRGAIHSLTGLCVQMILMGILVWLVRGASVGNASHILWAACTGLIVWIHLIVTYLLLKRETDHSDQTDYADSSPAEAKASTGGGHRIHPSHAIYHRWVVPVLELGAAALLFQSLRLSQDGKIAVTAPAVVSDLLLIAIHSIGTLVLIVFTVYLTHLMQVDTWQRIKCARNLTGLMVAMLIGLLADACSRHVGIPGADTAVAWGFFFINNLLGAEILFSMALRLFTPRAPNALFRPAFDFYLLEGLSRPMQSGFVFAAMLENIFGFDITQTAFGKRTRSLLIPAALLTALSLLGFSTIIIVRPHEQAIVMTLGHLQSKVLGPGLHFKPPWPVGSARHYGVSTIRSIHVGSHRSADGGRSVYRKGVPILWTNMHGLSMDELLICSSPQNRINGRINDAQRSGSSPAGMWAV